MTNTKREITKFKKDKDFIPPDGGWGWMIIIAAGVSNLAVLPVLQQFGLLLRDEFARLGISSSETTTVINLHAAMNSCVGLANGPLFKTFTYRQVSLAGALLAFIGLIGTTLSFNFATYLLSFSILYGAAYGISGSANALALNTYWKDRRRLATSLSWTTTGLGPVVWPIIITALFTRFGETGTILILSGFSLHAVACALLLQPVEWHAKSPKDKTGDQEKLLLNSNKGLKTFEKNKKNGLFSQIKNISVFSSQYLYNEDDPVNPGYEIIDPGTPMMLRANDGYYSQSRQSKSKISSTDCSTTNSQLNSRFNSKKPSMINLLENRSRKSSTLYLNESKKNSAVNLGALAQERDPSRPKVKASISLGIHIPESEIEDCPTLKAPQDLKANEKAVVEKINPVHVKYIDDKIETHLRDTRSHKSTKISGHNKDKYDKDNHSNMSLKNLEQDFEDRQYLKNNYSNQSYRTRYRRKSNNFNFESEVLKQASLKLEQYLMDREEADLVKSSMNRVDINGNDHIISDEKDDKLTFCQKLVLFFDLDLLKDFTFVNLMLGMTLAYFNELNFSILTPFILGDYGKSKEEVALFMSLLAGVDLGVRFCIPFMAGKIGWHNNTFFLFGVLMMSFGRVVLACSQDYYILILVAVIIGFGKGLRTVFMALVIPTHVPLDKLPGASGLQLVTAGVAYLTLGPVVGWIKDNASTAVTLLCLNIFTWMTALSWGLEKYIRAKRQNSEEQDVYKP